MYYIYFHKNPITLEVFYVGIGSNKRAWRFKERNTHWLRYVKKHGFPVVEIIKENLTKEEAGLLEIEYIQQFRRKGYDIEGKLVNISLGGKGGTKGYYWDDERKKKYSEKIKKWMNNEENKEKWKHKHKIGIQKRQIDYSKFKKGVNGIPINQYDLENNFLKTWPSAKFIKDNIKINIDEALAGRAKTAGGYIWKYEKETNRNREKN